MNASALEAAPRYRADIDGLRGVSVAAVLLFHAHVPGFGGGFIGVDVFFVISGYLITQLLLVNPAEPPKQRLQRFYLRRARRILPALLVVMAATAAAAWCLFTPAELRGFGRSLMLCAAFAGNYAAWTTSGYFDTPWTFTPLLHLWSISVEEQFYLAYPLALWCVVRFVPPRWRLRAVAGVAIGSFGLCVWGSAHHPLINYYSAPTRAWELLLGAMVAMSGPVRGAAARRFAWLPVAALAVIVGCILVYDSLTPFPGWYALWPCLGAAVLLAMPGGATATLLSSRPLVFVGLISYSLYLWHVPILALHEYFTVVKPAASVTAWLLLSVFIIGAASWKWIEQPPRMRVVLASNKVFAWVMALSIAGLIAIGATWSRSDGYPQRFPPGMQKLAAAFNPDALIVRCMRRSPAQVADGDLCRFGEDRASDRVLLWGDSHALAALPAVSELAARHGMELRFGAVSSCQPLLGVLNGRGDPAVQRRCAEFNEALVRGAAQLRPKLVILSAYWAFPGSNYQPLPGLPVDGTDTAFDRGLEQMLRALGASGARVCLVRGVPVFRYPVPQALRMAQLRGVDAGFDALPRLQARVAQQEFNRGFDALERRGLAHTVDPFDLLCPGKECRMLDDAGNALYRDDNHLSEAGARFIAPVIDACF